MRGKRGKRARPALRCMALALLSAGLLNPALAQPDAGQILNQQQRAQPRPVERLPQKEATPEQLQRPAPGAVKVLIRAIHIRTDPALATQAELQAQVADAIGQEFDYDGLQLIAQRITGYLRARGYALAYAYLPAQSLDGGVLEIAIQPGRMDGKADGGGIVVHAEGARIKPEIIRDMVATAVLRAGEGLPLHTGALERGLLLVNDLPGIVARAALEPGTAAGTSRVLVRAEEGPLLGASVSVDNQGNRYSGKWRGNAQFYLNDPLHIGDQASLSLAHASGLNQVSLAYQLPVGSDGRQLGALVNLMNYRIGQELVSLDARGTITSARLSASQALVRTRERSLWASLAYEHKRLQDETLGVPVHDKRVDALNLGVNANLQDALGGAGVSSLGMTLVLGKLDLSGVAEDLGADRQSAHTDGRYTKASLNLARLQRITERLSLHATVSAQFAGRNLDSSEKFILGGPSGVRAYPGGEGSGDTGWVSSLELRYDLPGWSGSAGSLQLVGFADTGQVTLHRNPWVGSVTNAGNANSYGLSGAGFGVNMSTRAGLSLRTTLARTLGDNPGWSATTDQNTEGRTDRWQFWVQIAAAF
ncbi:MAG: ShlB/FhaC/HecB family hemolysin secretion/activation protein [Rhodoferax sp.]|uniref:ShlB/FhaC/HecB family hemolysin secretion/activation protein n=1 Tax=Rhodoferax sp. TaxID=50421 RepID=UPI0026343154|nr:ShlB/FhaC/HecB family hemolysin secretion/activation protein [Rhodoferax sp.]MDD5332741.1 ShlB/FhaC/HecB family hemolysin secretion/activation protein [Rhodoferax sp.]